MNLSFSLCSRCKMMAQFSRVSLCHITIESRIYGAVCEKCRKYISDKVEEMMNEIPIPEALQPYLIQAQCPACAGLSDVRHIDGCPHKNFLES
jgi:hypothetical protein